MTTEVHSFQAEVQQLLNLMIHSLYSNKEIFLRELVSNSSDALDKLRFEEITNRDLAEASASTGEKSIKISAFPETNRLVIEDNGIGMSHDELVQNLGTIANSGTKKFLEKLNDSQKSDANLIGQFGVGFYSAFMVAEKIIVESRSAKGDTAWQWESEGNGTYTMTEGTRTTAGTRLELVLKPEEKEFLEEWRLRGILKKYSNYVTYPILMAGAENAEERVNQSTPVWAKNKRENKPEDYNDLYKQISHDYRDPLLYEHMSAEGIMPFQAVVFVPSAVPFDLNQRDNLGLHLYVKRVSITDKCKELVPEYLRFISGVVETDEIPLNVSREILQQNAKLPAIKKQIVKKVLTSLQTLAKNDAEKYKGFYENFGAVLKEGFHFDRDNHEALGELVRFHSSKTGRDSWVSFQEYLDRKVEGQQDIYYITGPSYDALAKSPHLEAVQSRDIEVLFLTDPIDEWFVLDYEKHKEASLKSITKGDLDLAGVGKPPADDVAKDEVPAVELEDLLAVFRTQLSGDVKDVKASHRLTESACCLVADENGMSSQLERIMKASNKDFAGSKRILEVNPSHPLIKNLAALKAAGVEDSKMSEWVDILYETALLSEGSSVKNPGEFAKKITRIMERAAVQQ